MIGTDHFVEAVMARRFPTQARTCLLELAFFAGAAVFAWLDPVAYAKVFLRVEVVVLTLLVFVLVVLVRIFYFQRRARRARSREPGVVISFRD